MSDMRLITLDPGHFHAALVQKEMYPGISPRVAVFAPLGPDLMEHLHRIVLFNTRAGSPTAWELDVHANDEFLAGMLASKPGNVVVLAGKNRRKFDYIDQSVRSGLNVLADKPWIIRSDKLAALEACLNLADETGITAYDIMTERFEVTSLLQRELVNTPGVFGDLAPGSVDEPAVYMESVHQIRKLVAGVPLRRPDWFFDIVEQGEGLSDVGTHLVDLAQWTLFPEQAIDYRNEIEIRAAKRWPTPLSPDEYRQVTGSGAFPDYVSEYVQDGRLQYFCNNQVSYTLRGVHIKLDVLWNYEDTSDARDTHLAIYRGTNSRIEVRQKGEQGNQPELYVVPNRESDAEQTFAAVESKIGALLNQYPGIAAERAGAELKVTIPASLRIGHEAHFAQVARQFFQYKRGEAAMPAWEKPNMLAKYYVSTKGVELAQ